jgi:hypothetical protein
MVDFYAGNEYIFIDQRFSEYRQTYKELWISYVEKAIRNLSVPQARLRSKTPPG